MNNEMANWLVQQVQSGALQADGKISFIRREFQRRDTSS